MHLPAKSCRPQNQLISVTSLNLFAGALIFRVRRDATNRPGRRSLCRINKKLCEGKTGDCRGGRGLMLADTAASMTRWARERRGGGTARQPRCTDDRPLSQPHTMLCHSPVTTPSVPPLPPSAHISVPASSSLLYRGLLGRLKTTHQAGSHCGLEGAHSRGLCFTEFNTVTREYLRRNTGQCGRVVYEQAVRGGAGVRLSSPSATDTRGREKLQQHAHLAFIIHTACMQPAMPPTRKSLPVFVPMCTYS